MPSPDQIQELIDNTTTALTTSDGVSGMTFTSKKNGKSIFIPTAGYACDGSVDNGGNEAYVWSSTLYMEDVGGRTEPLLRYERCRFGRLRSPLWTF